MTTTSHTNRAHAVLSASGAERWLNCTPSARFEENFPNKSSDASKEGTLAHEMAEVILEHELGKTTKKVYQKKMYDLAKSPYRYEETESDVRLYTDLVMESYHNAVSEYGKEDVEFHIEQKLNLTDYIEEGFGTADFVMMAGRTLHVTDLKFGKGVAVSAYKNKQLMLYGLGALEHFSVFNEFENVVLTIIQPGIENYSTYEISVDDLLAFGEEIKLKAKEAYEGNGDFTSGDHCKWCRGKHRCKAFAEQQLKQAKAEFALDPDNMDRPTLHELNMLSDEELVNIHLASKNVTKWLDEVKDYMITEAEAGREWEGLQLVDGKSVRYWLSEHDAEKVLKGQGLNEDQIIKKTLQGITAVEKLLGKTRFAEVEKLVVGRKNQAKQLIRADVKKIEKQNAKDVFAD